MLSGNPPALGIYETSSDARYAQNLGALYELPDGRVFRFCKADGSGLATNKMTAEANAVTNNTDMALATAAAIGATTVTVTVGGTAVTENQYVGGQLNVIDGAGEGQSFEVISHPAANGGASCAIRIREAVRVALATATSRLSLKYPRYGAVQTMPNDSLDSLVGVPLVAVTASHYHWEQQAGDCLVLAAGGWTKGDSLVPGGVAGGLKVAAAFTDKPIAEARDAATDTEYGEATLRLL